MYTSSGIPQSPEPGKPSKNSKHTKTWCAFLDFDQIRSYGTICGCVLLKKNIFYNSVKLICDEMLTGLPPTKLRCGAPNTSKHGTAPKGSCPGAHEAGEEDGEDRLENVGQELPGEVTDDGRDPLNMSEDTHFSAQSLW